MSRLTYLKKSCSRGLKDKNGKVNWVCIIEGFESRLKNLYVFF